MLACRAMHNLFVGFSSPNDNFLANLHLFRPERKTVENIRFRARFWSQKSPKIGFPLFLRSKLQQAPTTRFGRKGAEFCKKSALFAPEAFILRPSRKTFCRQCFLGVLKAIFTLFRTFRSFYNFVVKGDFERKSRFSAPKRYFCVSGNLLGSFSHPGAHVALDYGFSRV